MKMRIRKLIAKNFVFFFLWMGIFISGFPLSAQQTNITDYVFFGGKPAAGQTPPASPGYGVFIATSNSVQGGIIGSYELVRSTGNLVVNGNIFSGGRVELANSNTVSGRITVANPSFLPGNVLTVGSNAVLQGNIDVHGSILISGGIVTGQVTHPAETIYSGPVPGGGEVIGPPQLPQLPQMPEIINFPAPDLTKNISSTQTITPGSYGNITLNGNKKLTFDGVGVYVFNSIKNSGSSNDFIFDFKNNPSGTIKIYVHGDVDLNKVQASIINGGHASRIYSETHGTGSTSSNGTVAWTIANGSAGQASKWLGSVWAPYAAINIGSGTGSTNVTGALWSGTQVNIQSGISMVFAAFDSCTYPDANAGPDKPLDFSTQTTLIGTSSTPGVTFSWQAINGGIIDPSYSSPNNDTIKVLVAGTYILTVTSDGNCFTRDSVVVTGRLRSLIGSELQSIYDNNTTDTTFFLIEDGYVLIDIIALDGFRDSVARRLMNDVVNFGLKDTIPNGTSNFIITGFYPVINLPNLNLLFEIINYVRPHYTGYTNSGIVNSAGDTTIRSYLVRKGYAVNGDGIKIGVLSDSYATITSGTTATLPLQPFPPGPQTFNTNTAAQDVANGDLPGDTTFTVGGHVVNPNGFIKNVHVLQDYPFRRTDEGRAMLQIIHDVAPGAELYFRTGIFTAGDFAAGIHQLKNTGCDIIVDDITYPTEPYLKDGIVAKAVDSVVKNGATYFSAAGNFARQSYEKDFSASAVTSGPFAGKMAHNFGAGDLFQQVKLPPGNYLFVFQWLDNIYSTGETAGTQYDMDIYLTPNTDGTSVVGYNRDNSDGDPIEFIPFTVLPGADSIYNVFIVNHTTTGNPARIKYIVYRDGHKMQFLEFNEGNSTIIGQSNADSAITVGAARYDKAPPYQSPPLIESFSSLGGTKTNGVVRNKPDIVAPDGVNTTVKLGQDYPNDNLDGFPNFFGTSGAAPHAAAAAALIMEGKKKFLNQLVTPPYEIRSILKNTAINMETPGFDFVSGHGLINIDLAMRSFAAPTPSLNALVVPTTTPPTIPGNSVFTVTVLGDNFSSNSILYFRDSALASTVILDTVNGIATAIIPEFDDNPPIRMYTPPYPTTNGLDGGFSNSLFFFDANITVRVDSITKQYSQVVPALTAKIYINDVLLDDTTLTLADIGLDNMIISTAATASSDVGTYAINAAFDPTDPPHDSLLQKYRYTFVPGLLTIEQLPLTINVQDVTVQYGDLIPNIAFSYQFDPTNIADPGALLNTIQTSHQSQLARDAQGHDILGLVNGQAVTIVNGQAIPIVNGQAVTIVNGQAVTIVNGQAIPIVNGQALTIVNGIVTDTSGIELSPAEIENLSFLATDETLQNTRQISNQTLVNGTYVPSTSSIVDITQESILDYNVNAAQTQMLNAVSNVEAKGMVDIESYLNGQAITIVNGQAITIVNGQAITIVNGQAVTIVNGQAVTIVNGQAIPIVNSDNRTGVILDSSEIGQGINQLKSLNIISGLTAGEQFILPGAFNNSNYDITIIPGTLTINPAPLQVKADNQSRPYGESNPPLTVTYSGFVIGEDLQNSDVTGAPSVSTTATVTSPTGNYPIVVSQGTLLSSNYAFNFVSGVLTVTNNPCLLTHTPFKNFGNTPAPQQPTSLWLNMVTKVSGQLSSHGDYLLFKTGTVTFNNINSTPLINNFPIPDGKIIADNNATSPVTSFDAANNTWITKVPVGYASTSDVFITGAIINSSNGFVKRNGNTNSVVSGIFFSNKNFSDQWAYGIAAYRPLFAYNEIGGEGQVASTNGTYRAGTPIPIIANLVSGGSGGGGNNYTGGNSSVDNFTACMPDGSPAVNRELYTSSMTQEETKNVLNNENVQVVPNPASDQITIYFVPEKTGNSVIILSSIDGRPLIEINNGIAEAGKRYQKLVNVSKLSNGIYLVRVITEGIITVKKIVIQK